ncbi:hypothetical protein [Sulfurimonas sp.]|nr:hypothetical protein [Sulfurimonas sp.]
MASLAAEALKLTPVGVDFICLPKELVPLASLAAQALKLTPAG